MIKTDRELKKAQEELLCSKKSIELQNEHFSKEGFSGEPLNRLMAPLNFRCNSLKEDIDEYMKLKSGSTPPKINNYSENGLFLIKCRIYKNISQAELARRLNVDPSQVSRDERHEYYNITTKRYSDILSALEIEVTLSLNTPTPKVQLQPSNISTAQPTPPLRLKHESFVKKVTRKKMQQLLTKMIITQRDIISGKSHTVRFIKESSNLTIAAQLQEFSSTQSREPIIAVSLPHKVFLETLSKKDLFTQQLFHTKSANSYTPQRRIDNCNNRLRRLGSI